MDKITLTLATAKISLDEVKYNFDAGQNLIVEDNITHSVARRYSNRFLRLFFSLKTAENKEYSGNGFCRARIIM